MMLIANPLLAADKPSVSGVVVEAMTLLKQIGVLVNAEIVPIDRVHKPPQVSINAEGFTFLDDPHVYVATWSETYQAAERGDRNAIMKIASVIAHEAVHTHGGGEKEAYKVQVSVLRMIGASPNLINGVMRSAKTVGR
ncbi:MAG: hypothetical protein AAB857_03395 [Patescibacteria group bacterium]